MRTLVVTLLCNLLLLACARPRVTLRAADPVGPEVRKVELSLGYRFVVPGKTQWIRFLVAVPRTVEGRQKVLSLRYRGRQPRRLYVARGTRFAEYRFEAPEGHFEVWIDAHLEVYRSDWSTLHIRDNKPLDLSRYTAAERYLEVKDPLIQKELAGLGLPKRNDLETVRALYRYVLRKLRYSRYNSYSIGAIATLKSGSGDCTDYTDLLVTLARAVGIPARHVTGWIVSRSGVPQHSWAELFTKAYGWVPLDPLHGDLGRTTPEKRPPVYVHLYDNRNEPVVDFYRYWYQGAPIRVRHTIVLGGRTYREWSQPIRR